MLNFNGNRLKVIRTFKSNFFLVFLIIIATSKPKLAIKEKIIITI